MKIIELLRREGINIKSFLTYKLTQDEIWKDKYNLLRELAIPIKTIAFRTLRDGKTFFVTIVASENKRVPKSVLEKFGLEKLERKKALKRKFNLERGYVNPIVPLLVYKYKEQCLIIDSEINNNNSNTIVEIPISPYESIVIYLSDLIKLFKKYNLPIIYL